MCLNHDCKNIEEHQSNICSLAIFTLDTLLENSGCSKQDPKVVHVTLQAKIIIYIKKEEEEEENLTGKCTQHVHFRKCDQYNLL